VQRPFTAASHPALKSEGVQSCFHLLNSTAWKMDLAYDPYKDTAAYPFWRTSDPLILVSRVGLRGNPGMSFLDIHCYRMLTGSAPGCGTLGRRPRYTLGCLLR